MAGSEANVAMNRLLLECVFSKAWFFSLDNKWKEKKNNPFSYKKVLFLSPSLLETGSHVSHAGLELTI